MKLVCKVVLMIFSILSFQPKVVAESFKSDLEYYKNWFNVDSTKTFFISNVFTGNFDESYWRDAVSRIVNYITRESTTLGKKDSKIAASLNELINYNNRIVYVIKMVRKDYVYRNSFRNIEEQQRGSEQVIKLNHLAQQIAKEKQHLTILRTTMLLPGKKNAIDMMIKFADVLKQIAEKVVNDYRDLVMKAR